MIYRSSSSIFIISLLLQLIVCQDDDVCDAPVADTCFSDVEDDLRFVFNPRNQYAQEKNETALRDLCDAWQDSLQCTKDIIDTTCTKDEGKERFDKWHNGLSRVIDLLCLNGMTSLKVIASTIECWNILTFFHCVENKTNLNSIEDLLKTPLSGNECDEIKFAFDDCHLEATNFACPLYEVIRSNVATVLLELFNEIDCVEKPKPTKVVMINCSSFNNFILAHFLVAVLVSLILCE